MEHRRADLYVGAVKCVCEEEMPIVLTPSGPGVPGQARVRMHASSVRECARRVRLLAPEIDTRLVAAIRGGGLSNLIRRDHTDPGPLVWELATTKEPIIALAAVLGKSMPLATVRSWDAYLREHYGLIRIGPQWLAEHEVTSRQCVP